MDASLDRHALRDLPLAARLVLAAFLISVGIGYFSALVQLHFQGGTKAGEMLPGPDEAVNTYHGPTGQPMSKIETLLVRTEGSFNGSGTMRPAFFEKSSQWTTTKKRSSEEKMQELLQHREGEILAVLDWIRSGASKEAYDKDDHPIQDATAAGHALTGEFLVTEDDKPAVPRRVKIRSLLEERCASCHSEHGRDTHAQQVPLDSYEKLKPHLRVQASGGMSLPKLAQTTHVHLLGFSMLYGLTGLLFAFTSYPAWVRVIIAPWPLLMQVVDISCWWLGRVDPLFAQVIVVTGGLVAVGLMLQIVGGLFNLFGNAGKLVLLLLLVATAAGGYVIKERVVGPYLQAEKTAANP